MRLRIALLAGLVLVSAPGCGGGAGARPSTAGGGPHLITPDEARQVVADFEGANNEVLASHDVARNDRIEEGPLAAVDDLGYRSKQLRGDRRRPTVAIHVEGILVPRESAYPGHFVAAATETGSDEPAERTLMLFVKDGEQAPWRAALDVTLPGVSELPRFAVDGDGYGHALAADEQRRLPADGPAAIQRFAAYLEASLRDSPPAGTPANGFAPGPGTSGLARALAEIREREAGDSTVSFQVRPAAGPAPVVVELAGGSALALGEVDVEIAQVALDGRVFEQNPSRTKQAGTVSPGSYRTLTETLAVTTAIRVPASGSAPLEVVAQFTGDTRVEGGA